MKSKEKNKALDKVAAWKQLLLQELSWSVAKTDQHITRLLEFFKHLQYGSATLVYRSKQGEVLLTTASLIPYADYFRRPFEWENLNNTIPFWNEEKKCWTTFDMCNFIDWRIAYPFN